MKDFIEFLKRQGIIPYLKEVYKISSNNEADKEIFERIIDILLNVSNFEKLYRRKNSDTRSNLDLIAWIYESNVSKEQRKILGEFYTPSQIVEYILNNVEYSYKKPIENQRLIDISCGSGSFLVKAIDRLISKFLINFNVIKISSLTIREVKEIVLKVRENIIGIDINPIACILCQLNIYFSLFELINLILEKEEDYSLPTFNIYHSNTLEFNFIQKYDYVVGNPPYVFIRDIVPEQRRLIENSNFETAVGQYDYYQIFIEIGIRILKEHGFLGYIVPDSLLVLSNRKLIRRFIFDSTKIRELYYVGSQFEVPVVSNVIIILQKELNKTEREENSIMINHNEFTSNVDDRIVQKMLKKWDYKFLINLNKKDIEILDFLNSNFPKMQDLNKDAKFEILISRGVELGKNGKIFFCKSCKKYYPLPKGNLKCKECNTKFNKNAIEQIVVDIFPQGLNDNYKPYLFSLNRYQAKEFKYINIVKEGINYKNLDIYKNRIVVRQLSQDNLICASYDKESLTSQSIYNIKLVHSEVSEFNHFYLLGLLNSQLLSYYFIKSFGSYKKLFPRILIEKLKALPIKLPETKNEKNLARHLIESVNLTLNNVKNDKEVIDNLQHDSDLFVFNLYQIDNEDRSYITNYLENLKILT